VRVDVASLSRATLTAMLAQLSADIAACRRCKRLVKCRESVVPPKRFVGLPYWKKPVPGFGDPDATLLVVGLAPAANGANRTGRVFTGYRSGVWLFAALHRAGLANQPTSTSVDDGLTLQGAYVSCVVRCAPPGNHPTPAERDRCLPYLEAELAALAKVRAIVALGGFAWDGVLRLFDTRAKFGHGAETEAGGYQIFGSYHVSQQNTFTGRLTEPMLDAVFARAISAASRASS